MNDVRSSKRSMVLVLRIGVAVIPVLWVLHKVDARTVLGSMRAVGAPMFLAMSLVPLGSASVAPLRWRVLLRGYGATGPIPLRTLWRYHLVGAYFNALPGAIAGDALRAMRTAHFLSGPADAAAVVVVERVAGLVGLLLLGSTSLFSAGGGEHAAVAGTLAAGAVLAAVLATVLCASPALYRRFVREPPRSWLLARVDGVLRRIPTPRSIGALVLAVAISLVTQGLPMFQILALSTVLAPGVPVGGLIFVLPAIILLTYIPITPAAVGQRDLVYVGLLGTAGVPADAAVAISLIVLGSTLLLTVVGALVHLAELLFGWENGPRSRK